MQILLKNRNREEVKGLKLSVDEIYGFCQEQGRISPKSVKCVREIKLRKEIVKVENSGDKSWMKKPKSFPHLLIRTPWFKSWGS